MKDYNESTEIMKSFLIQSIPTTLDIQFLELHKTDSQPYCY